MWTDTETTDDLLNFSIIAQTAAQLIKDSDSAPLSIGVSGNWGTGKSSLVKMIGEKLKEDEADKSRFVFLEFNAWLYQGYDDARMALLQSVSDCLLEETHRRKTNVEKATEFAKRINWLKIGKLLAPAAAGAVIGGTVAGPIGAVVGAAQGLAKKGASATSEDYDKVSEACGSLGTDLTGILAEKKGISLPKEIDGIRKAFEELLREMDITLVVLVDDLDRCLPDTAISTLEAMRLLLLLPRTAFIIAADEEMIRHAVRHHFDGIDIGEDLVTSYFDKLIQIPLRVPRLGHAEVKGYLILLFAQLEVRRNKLTEKEYEKAKEAILKSVKESWGSGLTREAMGTAFSGHEVMKPLIGLADQIAGLLTTANQIAGNPRLIKRFLNDLNIRKTVADAEGMSLAYEALLKLQLFERCVTPAAFEFLVSESSKSEEGKPSFLAKLELMLADGKDYVEPDESWKDPFIETWMKLHPPLGDLDLRPILNLSRTQVSATVSYDKLSSQALEVIENIVECKDVEPFIVKRVRELTEAEAEQILVRLSRKARGEQFSTPSILRIMNVTEAYPGLGSNLATLLAEIPAKGRKAPLIPHLKGKPWAKEIMRKWGDDPRTPNPARKAIKAN
ncbi:MAG: KAP family P-loop NTPase fold protein [Luteolibacter sp.]